MEHQDRATQPTPVLTGIADQLFITNKDEAQFARDQVAENFFTLVLHRGCDVTPAEAENTFLLWQMLGRVVAVTPG